MGNNTQKQRYYLMNPVLGIPIMITSSTSKERALNSLRYSQRRDVVVLTRTEFYEFSMFDPIKLIKNDF